MVQDKAGANCTTYADVMFVASHTHTRTPHSSHKQTKSRTYVRWYVTHPPTHRISVVDTSLTHPLDRVIHDTSLTHKHTRTASSRGNCTLSSQIISCVSCAINIPGTLPFTKPVAVLLMLLNAHRFYCLLMMINTLDLTISTHDIISSLNCIRWWWMIPPSAWLRIISKRGVA